MNFKASAPIAANQDSPGLIFLFTSREILVESGTGKIPCLPKEKALALAEEDLYYLGRLRGKDCYAGRLNPGGFEDTPFKPINIRAFYHTGDDDFRAAAGFARQISDLHANNRFCGKCSGPTTPVPTEHARTCPACNLTVYPRISPAVIMAVTKGEEILLARGVNFQNKEMFSVLAGFVSPSETLEECVSREVFEETGIEVKNVTYVKSQPWPFPDSLMIGFRAEYERGRIKIDPEEILEAAWFKADALPLTPNEYSLAGQLIRAFIQENA